MLSLIDALWLSALRTNFQENTKALRLGDKIGFLEANDLHFASHARHHVGVKVSKCGGYALLFLQNNCFLFTLVVVFLVILRMCHTY